MHFLEELNIQRWDDHRFYHRCRINQALHFFSAISFLTSYVLIFFNPIAAVMIGWLLAMLLRQAGHFFFEPKDYDNVNDASHDYKESIKVGYNLKRKIILLSIWIAAPVVLSFDRSLWGLFEMREGTIGFLHNLSLMWFFLGIGALLFRTVHLFFIYNVQAGLVWFTKILTDPFHDIRIYHKAPLLLLKGNRRDDMSEWHGGPPPEQHAA